MYVLGIESSCDETSCAIVQDGKTILSNVIASQIDLHSLYGGVVPELACRRHIDVMIPTIESALEQANLTLQDIDLIAVAHGPGLIGALMLGVNTAKTLAMSLNIPFIGVNHVEAHLYAAFMSAETPPQLPCLGVVLSGCHSSIVLIRDVGDYCLIGETIDDAIGEAFDKVAKMLDLPYPGGPQIEALAKQGNPNRHAFKCGRVKDRPYHFSFSGLKTAALYAIRGQNERLGGNEHLNQEERADIAASFQRSAFDNVITKTALAAKEYGCRAIALGGGVTNSKTLRALFTEKAPELSYYWPSFELSLDNAAMIAGLGYHEFQKRQQGDGFDLEAVTRIPFTPLTKIVEHKIRLPV